VLFQATFNDPHMEINGEVKKISVDYWGQQTLSPEEYQLFKAAAYRQGVMWSRMLSDGRAEMTKNSESATTSLTLSEIVLHDPEYVKFMRQMLRDPAVTWPGPGIKPIY
jgi:hypothetical protein